MSDVDDLYRYATSGHEAPSLEDVRAEFASRLFLPDQTIVDVCLGTYVAHKMAGDPVWVLIVGASGRGKTEVIVTLSGLDAVHGLSALTPQTFASGLRGKEDASLLHRLERDGRSFLTLKDLTTVLTLHRDARAEIFAQLREIYDGSYRKEFGSGVTVSWEGRLGFLGGVTPVIDQHHAATALLGERFLYLRLPEVSRRELSRRALRAVGTEAEMRADLREIVRRFVEGLTITDPALSETTLDALGALADVATWIRSGVVRDGYSRDIASLPEPEAPTRMAKQLAGMVRALIVLGRTEPDALEVAMRMAADSTPPTRLAVFRTLASAADWVDTTEVGTAIGLPSTTARRVLEDLEALGAVRRRSDGGGAHRWLPSEQGLERLTEAGLGVEKRSRNVGTPDANPSLPGLPIPPHPPLPTFRESEAQPKESASARMVARVARETGAA